MQNVQTIQSEEDDNLDSAKGQGLLLGSKLEPEQEPEAPIEPLTKSQTPSSETVQSDTEQRPSTKLKGRSRFSSAIRKLSVSTRKKHPTTTKDTLPEPAQSSGPEDQPATTGTILLDTETTDASSPPKEIELKKKGRNYKRFLLPALKKSKVSPTAKNVARSDNDGDGDNDDKIVVKDVEQVTTTTDSDLKIAEKIPAKKPPTATAESPTSTVKTSAAAAIKLPPTRQSKVQITISGKKESQKSVSGGDTNYLTPAAAEGAVIDASTEPPKTKSTSTSKLTSGEFLKSTQKKKLKSKKQTSTAAATPFAPSKSSSTRTISPASVVGGSASANASADEKFVITQSTRDTPPNEQAPLKPSRTFAVASPSLFSQSTESTEVTPSETTAIRKQAARSASSSIISQRSVGNKQLASGAKVTSVEAELMQTPWSSTQRGHRLPRPSSTTAQQSISTTTTTAAAATTTTQEQQLTPIGELSPQTQQKLLQQRQKQRQIQFQSLLESSQSHASQSLPQFIEAEEQQQQQQQQQQLQSSVSKLQPPTIYSPLPPSQQKNPAVTPEIRSPIQQDKLIQQQHHHHHQHTIPYADESVLAATSNRADQYRTSAEKLEDYDAEVAAYLDPDNKDKTARLKRQDYSDYDSSKSSGSQSPLSESSRKRIQYVAQPTIYESNEPKASHRKQNEDIRILTGIGESAFEADSDSADQQMPAFGDLTMDEEMEPTIMTSTNVEKREHLYKILVIGELGTGKTSFIKRYVHQFFSQNYRATIGVDFALKVLHWDQNTIVRLQLWDIAGQERFGNMTRVYYKEAVGAFIVFDVTRSGTFECVSKWKEDLDSKVQLPDGSPIPCILLANKCDQEKQGIVTQPEKMDEYVKENGFAGWFETSAKENINIDEAARALVSKILLNDKLISASDLTDSERFNLNNPGDLSELESKKCFC